MTEVPVFPADPDGLDFRFRVGTSILTEFAMSHTPADVLRLNVGSYASARLYNTATDDAKPNDGHETLTVTQGPTANSVYVSGYGVQNQEYDGVTKIVADGAAGNDTIKVNVGSNIDVDLATALFLGHPFQPALETGTAAQVTGHVPANLDLDNRRRLQAEERIKAGHFMNAVQRRAGPFR